MDHPPNTLLKALFVAVALTVLLAFFLNHRPAPTAIPEVPDLKPPTIKAGINPQRMAPSVSLKERMERTLASSGPAIPVAPLSLAEMLQDPEIRKRHDEHQNVMNYLKSPARDTKECQEMLRILRENGFGIAELRPVYRRAWEIHMKDPLENIPGTEGVYGETNAAGRLEARKSFVAEMANIFFEELKRGVDGIQITNEVLIRSLLAIRPQVDYGEKFGYKVDNDVNTWRREADLEQLTQTARDDPNAFPDVGVPFGPITPQ